MSETSKPVFLVDAYADPILVRIEGRASFLNSAGLKDFFNELIREGKSRFVVDFKHCTSMDSTFLGVLAGAALQLRKLNPPGTLTLARVQDRNLDLIHNLGLHRIAQVDAGEFKSSSQPPMQALEPNSTGEKESARLVLEAHESLIAADAANAGKFQDVLAFLRNRVEGR